MKTNKHLFFLTIVLYVGIPNCFAQQSFSASGGDIISPSGSVSYSVGQVAYTTNIGSNGSVAQGVEQPYEISEVLSSIDFLDITKDLQVSPNPSTDILILNINNNKDLKLNYQIIDINGKVVKGESITSNKTDIIVDYLPSSIYFLKVLSLNKEVKVFKIIKK